MKDKHNKFVVFLDVDGVLNTLSTAETAPSGDIGIDSARVAILSRAMKKYGRGKISGDIVLTSDWKTTNMTNANYMYLISKLAEYKLEISGHTPGGKIDRGAGIVKYLEDHPEIKEYVILDDNTYDFGRYTNLWERLLLTNGIENARFAAIAPKNRVKSAVEARIFMDDIKSSS